MYDLVHEMHRKFKFHEAAINLNREKFIEFLKFRASQIREEVDELDEAIALNDAEAINDALIDIQVFTFGTLDFTMHTADVAAAFGTVMNANLAKQAGVKPERPNPFGFPDLLKPTGWTAPDLSSFSTKLRERIGEPNTGEIFEDAVVDVPDQQELKLEPKVPDAEPVGDLSKKK